MKATVDRDTCISCGLCEATSPDIFTLDSEGIAVAVEDELEESALESAKTCEELCPVDAIHVK